MCYYFECCATCSLDIWVLPIPPQVTFTLRFSLIAGYAVYNSPGGIMRAAVGHTFYSVLSVSGKNPIPIPSRECSAQPGETRIADARLAEFIDAWPTQKASTCTEGDVESELSVDKWGFISILPKMLRVRYPWGFCYNSSWIFRA